MAEEPFCFFAEILLRLAHFGALQMADFGGNLVESAGDDREGRQKVGMAVALDHLRRNRGRLQTKAARKFSLRAPASDGRICPPLRKTFPPALSSAARNEALDVALRARNTSWPV
jgi:hypothetical protein